MNKPSLYGLRYEQLEAWLLERGHRKFRAAQVWERLYRQRVSTLEEMTEVPEAVIELLEEHYTMQSMSEHVRQQSKDGTVKFLFRLYDGNLIETVLMRHKFGLSVCVTTQVGCNIGCSFCASGLIKKSRDLTGGEIVEQLMRAQLFLDSMGEGGQVSHIVVMGIGEPFDNYRNVSDFIHIAKDHKGMAIGAKHITVSTSGLASKIKQFADSDLNVNLAVSLHAPNNELRSRIMKINKAIPIEGLMESIDYYLQKRNRRMTIEYILLRDVNDGPDHAEQLVELMGPRRKGVNVNLIPYNPVDEHSQYQRSSQESIRRFYDVLKKGSISVSVRLEHGADIDAACGQLRSKQLSADKEDVSVAQ